MEYKYNFSKEKLDERVRAEWLINNRFPEYLYGFTRILSFADYYNSEIKPMLPSLSYKDANRYIYGVKLGAINVLFISDKETLELGDVVYFEYMPKDVYDAAPDKVQKALVPKKDLVYLNGFGCNCLVYLPISKIDNILHSYDEQINNLVLRFVRKYSPIIDESERKPKHLKNSTILERRMKKYRSEKLIWFEDIYNALKENETETIKFYLGGNPPEKHLDCYLLWIAERIYARSVFKYSYEVNGVQKNLFEEDIAAELFNILYKPGNINSEDRLTEYSLCRSEDEHILTAQYYYTKSRKDYWENIINNEYDNLADKIVKGRWIVALDNNFYGCENVDDFLKKMFLKYALLYDLLEVEQAYLENL